jgi:hypothetical protein
MTANKSGAIDVLARILFVWAGVLFVSFESILRAKELSPPNAVHARRAVHESVMKWRERASRANG